MEQLRSPVMLVRVAALTVVVFHVFAFGLWAPGADARVYYDASLTGFSHGDIFGTSFTYSPAAAWWLQPLQLLPFEAFRTLVAAVNMAGFVYLVGPIFAAAILLSQLLPVWIEFQFGNVNFALGAALVLAFRHPAWYAFPLLTKVTPGIGLVWFAVRRQWRPVAVALGSTALLALPSMVLHAPAWPTWIASLAANAGSDAQVGAPILLRGAVAAAIIAWGARTNRAWTVPVAAALVAHVNSYGWLIGLAAVPLLRDDWRRRTPPSQGDVSAMTTQASS